MAFCAKDTANIKDIFGMAPLLCDAQAGAETAFQILTAAATGSGLVHDCGSWIDHGSLASPEYMVRVNEIVDAVDHFMKGIPISEESLALEKMKHRPEPLAEDVA